jgi:hypothetical protein|tara:strand:+ start:588 stop:1022 length:435 start_codon:yes stop_codon:yes gene_type:complete
MPGKTKEGGGLETKKSAFYLKSGNTTPFKQMGASPLKQDYVGNIYDAKWNPGGTVDFEGKQIVKDKPRYKGTKSTNWKTVAKTKLRQYIPKVPKFSGRALLGTALLAGELIYSFGKESIKRKKEGKSEFNISKTSTNKPFTFNK